MATLVEVFRLDDHPPLKKRQSPLMIEDQLMMVMDLNKLDIIRENVPVKNKDFEEFFRKYQFLSSWELKKAFQISIKDVVNILSESVPCVGCRRSVERLYYQLMEIGELALDPLQVKTDGTLVIRDDVVSSPKMLCAIFSDHSERLSCLVDSQPRSKKSRRCVLHSWDLQKSRPVTPAWKDVWAVMHEKCKAEVLLIDFSILLSKLDNYLKKHRYDADCILLSKLDNYLKKHRFCADCRTKVMKAYNLLVEECDPTKEKGFVPALYQKIKRCLPGKHIHLPTETNYIDSLIARAEPELMGNRRERHAKTMEIAQEEVLTCVGICIYDRLHRIFLRLREEEFTCRVLASVSLEALGRSFETLVEKKRGITQLELLCEEITKEEYAKQQRKELKKLKKKRKKEKKNEVEIDNENDGKDSCECESEDCLDQPDEDNCCDCPKVKSPSTVERHKLQILDRKSKGQLKCYCEDCCFKNRTATANGHVPNAEKVCDGGTPAIRDNNNGYEHVEQSDKTRPPTNCASCQSCQAAQPKNKKREVGKECADCGYSSGNNSASVNSSPEGSEVACSDGFCDHDGECNGDSVQVKLRCSRTNGQFPMMLQEMLESPCSLDEEDDGECFIPAEEIQAFKAKMPLVDEKRLELRLELKQKFAELCIKSQAPRL